MLSKKMETALNDQIGRESAAEQLYLSMASWCETHKLPGVASFFYRQSQEERSHMLKFIRKGLFFLDREIPKMGANSDQIEKV